MTIDKSFDDKSLPVVSATEPVSPQNALDRCLTCEKITTLTPSMGFSAEMATSVTVILASFIGFPISTTHTLVGAVIGVGIAKSVSKVDFNQILKIVLSWVVTIPTGAIFTIAFYVFLRFILFV